MTFQILVTTDVHGAIHSTDFSSPDQKQTTGLSRIASALNTLRKTQDVIYIDNGDAFQGTPLTTYAHQHMDSFENPCATSFNHMKVDYINLGNHDFNYGEAVLLKYINEVNAPLLTSNVLYKGNPLGTTQIRDIDGIKVAFIGVVTHYIPNWEQPKNIQNFEFLDAFQTMKAEVERVSGSVDMVVGVYHGGLEKDPVTFEPTEIFTGENQGSMMTEIAGLDILITGHQHRSFVETVHDVLVTQGTMKAEEFALIDVDSKTRHASASLISSHSYEEDASLLESLKPLYLETQTWLDQEIGSIATGDLRIPDVAEARIHKHPLVSFLNQIQKEVTGADLSSIALFNGVKGFNASITMRDLVSTYIYPNTLVVKSITGRELKDYLEFNAYFFDINTSGEICVHPSYELPKPQHYNYDMVDGIEYTICVSQPRGQRIQDLSYKGSLVKDDAVYSLVLNNYRAIGGGNFDMIAKAPVIKAYTDEMVDIIMNYLQTHSPVVVQHQDNIQVVK